MKIKSRAQSILSSIMLTPESMTVSKIILRKNTSNIFFEN